MPSGTNWEVYTLGGGSLGSSNGTGTNASFDFPFGVAADGYGDVFVADSQNNAICPGISTNSSGYRQAAWKSWISPASAVLARSCNGNWMAGPRQTNDNVLSDLAPGNHAITFSNVAGFTTPAMQTVTVTAHQTNVATGNLRRCHCQHRFNASGNFASQLIDALRRNGRWTAEFGRPTKALSQALSIGSHTLCLQPTSLGWTTPASQIVVATNDQTTFATGIYLLQTGSLQVTILPLWRGRCRRAMAGGQQRLADQ